MSKKLRIVPVTKDQANEYIENFHRHLGKVDFILFAVGVAEDDRLCGVAVVKKTCFSRNG